MLDVCFPFPIATATFLPRHLSQLDAVPVADLTLEEMEALVQTRHMSERKAANRAQLET